MPPSAPLAPNDHLQLPRPKKNPSSPPVMQNNKEKHKAPDPPLDIVDDKSGVRYVCGKFLGEGGFARVFQVTKLTRDRPQLAAKVVFKESVATSKKKTKLYAEIKIHRVLAHPHIVKFLECFEDDVFIYMTLDLCENGNMMDLLRRRRSYTPPETRFYLVQLISACQYMHRSKVMHRDLKLGNIFLDGKMDLKIGDFGLAALVENPGDRRKTVCGTPNYIAPEVLYGKANGHSYEADVWSVGVILYTMLVGCPPFQTKEVKGIYNEPNTNARYLELIRRIKELDYVFPPEKPVEEEAKSLIREILNPEYSLRPSLDHIIKHPWFLSTFPSKIPLSALQTAPNFSYLTPAQSAVNFAKAKEYSMVGKNLPIVVPPPMQSPMKGKMSVERAMQEVAPAVRQQEREFERAVQPGSPISALIQSATRPMVVPPQGITTMRDSSAMRKFNTHSTRSPLAKELFGKAMKGKAKLELLGEEAEEEEEVDEIEDDDDEKPPSRPRPQQAANRQQLSPMKERLVLSAAGRKINAGSPGRRPSDSVGAGAGVGKVGGDRLVGLKKEVKSELLVGKRERRGEGGGGGGSLFEKMARNLGEAFRAKELGQVFRANEIDWQPEPPRLFIASWLDYCNKYGMSYAMTDGSIGVNFNDSSTLVLAPDKKTFDIIEPSENLHQSTRTSYPILSHPPELANRVYLLKHFDNYLCEKLVQSHEYSYQNLELKTGMVFVTRYLRMRFLVLFRLSNDVMQFNFEDHVKLIVSEEGLIVTVIDEKYRMTTWSLADLVHGRRAAISQRRYDQIMHKLKYAKDVLSKVESYMNAAPRKTRASRTAQISGKEGIDGKMLEAGQ